MYSASFGEFKSNIIVKKCKGYNIAFGYTVRLTEPFD